MKKILIVEDDMILMMINQRYISSLGHEIVGTATNGKDAIKIAQEKCPDYIIMDIRLDGDMDGIEIAEKIKEFADCKIIYVSGNSDPATKERATKTNMCAFFIKPISIEMLKNAIV